MVLQDLQSTSSGQNPSPSHTSLIVPTLLHACNAVGRGEERFNQPRSWTKPEEGETPSHHLTIDLLSVSQLNSAMSRFEEASSLHTAIRALRLRGQTFPPNLTPEQLAKRSQVIETMCQLLEKSRNETIELGIHEWTLSADER